MSSALSLAHIAKALDAAWTGDGALTIRRPVHPAAAQTPDDLAVAMADDLLPLLAECPAQSAMVHESAKDRPELAKMKAVIFVARPRLALSGLTQLFALTPYALPGIHPSAIVDATAQIGQDVSIGPGCYVGPGAVIGERAVLLSQISIGRDAQLGPDGLVHPGVRVGERVRIGARVIIHANAVIGADGFSFVTPEAGSVETAKATGTVQATNTRLLRIASLGTVVIGDDVEIGANACIDRGTLADTVIGNATKIDNLVQIGHNVRIGDTCMICGQSGIAGSTVIGDRVVIGGGSGLADHLKVGNDAVLMGGSRVGGHIAAQTVVVGYPAMPRDKALQQLIDLRRLHTLFEKVSDMEQRVQRLEPPPEKG